MSSREQPQPVVDDDVDVDDDYGDVDDDISLIAKPDWTDILSRLRSRAISSRCTSCWRTPRPTMSRRTVWSTQGETKIETNNLNENALTLIFKLGWITLNFKLGWVNHCPFFPLDATNIHSGRITTPARQLLDNWSFFSNCQGKGAPSLF